MKIFQILVIVQCLFMASCAPRHAAPGPEAMVRQRDCLAFKQRMLQHMEEMCTQRAASLTATQNEVEAARNSKSITQMKSALAKAAGELQQVQEHLKMNCERMKKMGEDHWGGAMSCGKRCDCMAHHGCSDHCDGGCGQNPDQK